MTFTSHRSILALVPLWILLLGTSAQGGENILINNGLAPPNPDNTFDEATHENDFIHVQNVGCNWEIQDPCSVPGAPTTIQVLDGADIEAIVSHETSSIWMDGGRIGYRIYTRDASELTMTGGMVTQHIISFDTSSITLSGGTAFHARVAHDSSLTMIGGTLSWGAWAQHTATFTLAGGSIGVDKDLGASDSAVIFVVGSDFAVDGTPVPYGDIATLTGRLTGTLAYGHAIDVNFKHAGAGNGFYDGTIRLVPVPEPSRWLLLVAGLGCLGALHRVRVRT
jgi:hypothetical protein